MQLVLVESCWSWGPQLEVSLPCQACILTVAESYSFWSCLLYEAVHGSLDFRRPSMPATWSAYGVSGFQSCSLDSTVAVRERRPHGDPHALYRKQRSFNLWSAVLMVPPWLAAMRWWL